MLHNHACHYHENHILNNLDDENLFKLNLILYFIYFEHP